MRTSDDLHEDAKSQDQWQSDWTASPTASFSGGERNHFFLNDGTGQQFADIAAVAGLDDPHDSRVWSRLDYDHDGLNDIVMVNSNSPVFELYENRIDEATSSTAVGNIIAVRLSGGNRLAQSSKTWSNRDAIGARITATLSDGRVLTRGHNRGEGFAAQNSATELIGIGKAKQVTKLEIRWPSGRTTQINDVSAGALVSVFENPADTPDATGVVRERYSDTVTLARNVAELEGQEFKLEAVVNTDESVDLRVYATMATWCESCKKHNPHYAELREALGESVALFGVPVDREDTHEMLRQYDEQYAPGYELLVELSDKDRETTKTLLSQHVPRDVLPSTIVTSRDGQVLLVKQGLPSVSELKALISG